MKTEARQKTILLYSDFNLFTLQGSSFSFGNIYNSIIFHRFAIMFSFFYQNERGGGGVGGERRGSIKTFNPNRLLQTVYLHTGDYRVSFWELIFPKVIGLKQYYISFVVISLLCDFYLGRGDPNYNPNLRLYLICLYTHLIHHSEIYPRDNIPDCNNPDDLFHTATERWTLVDIEASIIEPLYR